MLIAAILVAIFLFAASVYNAVEIRKLKLQISLRHAMPTLAERNKCGCGHHKSAHKPDGNMECQTANYSTTTHQFHQCPCVHFVSDAPDTDEINRIKQAMKETAEWLKD